MDSERKEKTRKRQKTAEIMIFFFIWILFDFCTKLVRVDSLNNKNNTPYCVRNEQKRKIRLLLAQLTDEFTMNFSRIHEKEKQKKIHEMPYMWIDILVMRWIRFLFMRRKIGTKILFNIFVMSLFSILYCLNFSVIFRFRFYSVIIRTNLFSWANIIAISFSANSKKTWHFLFSWSIFFSLKKDFNGMNWYPYNFAIDIVIVI